MASRRSSEEDSKFTARSSSEGAVELPPRYQAIALLGRGGGGEVWAVRDRILDRTLALKLLAATAGEDELMALVREATALSGLEGLGVPRVVAFGTLPASHRRYMVRELAPGRSLEEMLDDRAGAESNVVASLAALAEACEKLTSLHRAGLLHGDLKPANIVVDDAGHATLVDLGLAAPWREGGTQAKGLTPRYAAPELFTGAPLTVRAEVFALGATLNDLIARRGEELPGDKRQALLQVATRATADDPHARYPSVDELGSALRHAAALELEEETSDAWPVVGVDDESARLVQAVHTLGRGEVLVLEAPEGAGRSTLLRRLAWTLGVEGESVALLERPDHGDLTRALIDMELGAVTEDVAKPGIALVDDAVLLSPDSASRVAEAVRAGMRLVAAAPSDWATSLTGEKTNVVTFAVRPLDRDCSIDLVRRVAPSLAESVREHLIARAKGRPGRLRTMLRSMAHRPVVSIEDVDALLGGAAASMPSLTPGTRDGRLLDVERALDIGHLDLAATLLASLDDVPTVPKALLEARLALGRGDEVTAKAKLAQVADAALRSPHARSYRVILARAHLRSSANLEAAEEARRALESSDDDALAIEALCIRGIALGYSGKEDEGMAAIKRACALAESKGEKRLEGLAFGNLAILHQRVGRTAEARAAYERSLAAAESARDAVTVALTHLNVAGLARAEGDLAGALSHLEASVDMGRRAGGKIALTGALFNLANLDLFLGRYARARASIESLAGDRAGLSSISAATLLGLEAELFARTGDTSSAAERYGASAKAWSEQGRVHDAAEAQLERLLLLVRGAGADASRLGVELENVEHSLGERGFGEHEALASIVRAALAALRSDEQNAQNALDHAVKEARRIERREWEWIALDARARHAATLGNFALAKRDIDAALAILEETASRLPRDLREVFWDDPRRRSLREALVATQLPSGLRPFDASGGLRKRLPRDDGATSLFASGVMAEDRLARILEINRELANERDLRRLLSRVTEHAIAIVGAERGFVVLANEEGELETRSARDRAGELEGDRHREFSRSVAQQVVRDGEPVVVQRASDDARLAQAVSVHRLHIQSIACVPIRGSMRELETDDSMGAVGMRTIGALYLETRSRPGLRFQNELPSLIAFADQAAIAIENARLWSENRARTEALSASNLELKAAQEKLAAVLDRRTEQLQEARRDLREARATLRGHFGYAGLVGTSEAMRKIYALIERIRDADVPVLISGESGTGKEVVAKAIHASGLRAKKPYFGINCGAIPENLLESELFGHVRGAFTGAERDRKGLFREADGGTVLLDEIGELPLKMQSGLLRILQEKCVRPLGSAQEEPVDVRIVAATNRDLKAMVEAGTFREDLYYRLHVVEVHVPPLRGRIEDIPALLDHFMGIFAARYRRERKTIERDALRKLMSYEWPGNVRQLEHALLNAWLMSEGEDLSAHDFELPSALRSIPPPSKGSSEGATSSEPQASTRGVKPVTSKDDFKNSEKNRILAALQACDWNRVQAARMLGLPRRTFYRRLKEYEIV